MHTLSRYILRRILAPFLLSLLVLLFALSLERLLRITQTITEQGAPIGDALEVLAYLVPHYLGLAIPAALFLSVLLAFRRLYAGSELASMLNAGLPLRRLLRPVLGFAVVMAAVLLFLAGFVQPHARYAYRATLHEITEVTLAFRLQPGVFHRLSDTLVVRADDVSEGGGVLDRFFAEIDQPGGGRTVMTARDARVVRGEDGSDLVVRLHDGTIVREGESTAPGLIEFEEYAWTPPLDIGTPYGPRGQGERELTLAELMAGGPPERARETSPTEIRAELHARLVQALSLPVLTILAVPMALYGSGRTGRAYGMVLGVALLVFYEKLVGFTQAFAAEGAVPAWLGLWLPFVGLLALAWLLVRHASEGSARSLLTWLAWRHGASRRGAQGAAE